MNRSAKSNSAAQLNYHEQRKWRDLVVDPKPCECISIVTLVRTICAGTATVAQAADEGTNFQQQLHPIGRHYRIKKAERRVLSDHGCGPFPCMIADDAIVKALPFWWNSLRGIKGGLHRRGFTK